MVDCPQCVDGKTDVTDSRPAYANTAIRRRRACQSCGHRFTTFETSKDIGEMERELQKARTALRNIINIAEFAAAHHLIEEADKEIAEAQA